MEKDGVWAGGGGGEGRAGVGWSDVGWGGEKVYMKDSSQMSLIYYCIVKEML